MAVLNCWALYACTPLLSLSRACSLLHPTAPMDVRASRAMEREMRPERAAEIEGVIGGSIPTRIGVFLPKSNRPPAAALICSVPGAGEGLLLAGFDLGRNQPNLIYIGGVHDVNGACHLLERHFLVALDKRYALGAGLEDLGEPRFKCIPGGGLLIDLQRTVLGHLHHHQLAADVRGWLFLVRRWLGHERVQSLGRQGRNHHEDDQQDEQDVNQRHNIHFRYGALAGANLHSHDFVPFRRLSAGMALAKAFIRRWEAAGEAVYPFGSSPSADPARPRRLSGFRPPPRPPARTWWR